MSGMAPPRDDRPATTLTGAQFRDAMSRVAASVHIVTTDGPAGRFGLTASAVASVSDLPPTVLVCLNHRTPVNAAVKENRVFCVNALTKHDEPLADIFAGRSAEVAMDKRFTAGRWAACETGSPLLESGLVAFDCRVGEIVEASTHSVVFGTVVAVRIGGDHPALLYVNRGYRST